MTGGVMSQKFVVGAGLLVCSVCSYLLWLVVNPWI